MQMLIINGNLHNTLMQLIGLTNLGLQSHTCIPVQ